MAHQTRSCFCQTPSLFSLVLPAGQISWTREGPDCSPRQRLPIGPPSLSLGPHKGEAPAPPPDSPSPGILLPHMILTTAMASSLVNFLLFGMKSEVKGVEQYFCIKASAFECCSCCDQTTWKNKLKGERFSLFQGFETISAPRPRLLTLGPWESRMQGWWDALEEGNAPLMLVRKPRKRKKLWPSKPAFNFYQLSPYIPKFSEVSQLALPGWKF